MARIIYPWKTSLLKVPGLTKSSIFQEMRNKYPGTLNMKVPSPRIVKTVKLLVNRFIELEEGGQIPWIVCTTTSTVLMQALAKQVPATMMLTRLLRSINVTTEKLINLFKAPPPRDDFDPDPAGESLHVIETYGFLVWEDFTAFRYKGDRWENQFTALLGKRLDKRKMTLFLSLAPDGLSVENLSALLNNVENSIGKPCVALLKEVATWENFKVPLEAELTHNIREV